MIGPTIGRYEVQSKLGEGGMGSVWLAADPMLGRSVAVKVLPERFADSPEAKDRLLQEARSASQLHHPGIATVYEAGEHEGRLYLAFEHVDGETVAQRVKREGPLPIDEAVRIARETAAALGYAHANGILHRDVTAGNVMLDRTGAVKLVDFGLALPETQTRVTRPASAPGTLGYVAPEVVQGKPGDRRSDLYGLGAVLYEMLTGRLPFERDRAEALLYAVVHEELDPPSRYRKDLPVVLEDIVRRALARDPAQRFSTARELVTTLDAGDRGVPRQNGVRHGRRQRAALAAVAVVVVAALALWWRAREAGPRFESLAVLPLEISAEDAQESGYLATGLGDGLVTRLGRVSGLRITPWVTSSRYPASSLPLQEIGAELNVESLVVGSFHDEGDHLRIELSLVDSETGTVAWSGKFEDTRAGLLELQDLISHTLARQVRGGLTPEEDAALSRGPTDRAEAYDEYLRGAAALRGRGRDDDEQALARFETALAIDPRLAEAHVGIGAVHSARYDRGSSGEESLAMAEDSFRQALRIEPELISALRGLIRIRYYAGPNEECLQIAQKLQGLGQVTVEAIMAQAEGMLLGGLAEEAVPLLRTVQRLDPANEASHWFLVLASLWTGDFEATIEVGENYMRAIGEDAEIHADIAGAHYCLGNLDAARTHYERSLELFGDKAPSWLYAELALVGRELWSKDRARSLTQEGIELLESRSSAAGRMPLLDSDLAALYAAIGDTAKVMETGARLRWSRGSWFSNPECLLLVFAYQEVGETQIAADLLRELTARVESAGNAPANPRETPPERNGVVCMANWQQECGAGAQVPASSLRRLAGFADFVAAVGREVSRRKSLYGG